MKFTAPGIARGDRIPDLMLSIQTVVTDVALHHRLPRNCHRPDHPQDSGKSSNSTYAVSVTCFCNTTIVIKSPRDYHCHSSSKRHQRMMHLLGYDPVYLDDSTKAHFLSQFFQNRTCVTCKHETYFCKGYLMEVHVRSISHILSLYLQTIALNRNGSNPYRIEVQCPFNCLYRYSLVKPHRHYQSFEHSGPYTTIYCNILRFIRPELIMSESTRNPTSSLKDLLQLMIPLRFFGDRLFSIDDVCDSNGIQQPVGVMHEDFRTGKGASNGVMFHIESNLVGNLIH